MKNLLYLIAFSFCLFTCDEIPPDLGTANTGGGSGSPDEVVRKVLIEEFTGVRCVNCPAGSEAIEQLLDIHGDKLIAVSIHAGFFSLPFEENEFDFRTDDGSNILNLLGSPLGYPTGVVDRNIFDGEDELQIGKGKWAGTIEQQLAEEATVKLDFNSSYDAGSREVNFDIAVEYLTDLNISAPRLSVYMIENGIEDYQETPDGKQSDYLHKHVFRDAVTPFDGQVLDQGTTANTIEEVSLSYTLPESWDVSKVNAIAFVHDGGSTLNILQVEELHVAQ